MQTHEMDESGASPVDHQVQLPLRTYLPDHFVDDFAEEIHCLYKASKDYCSNYGIPLLQKLTLNDFYEICAAHSIIAPPKH